MHIYALQTLLLALVLIVSFGASASANNLVASLGSLPKHAELDEHRKPHGAFVELVRMMDLAYKAGTIEVGVYPFKRSIANAINGKANFHLPLIRSGLLDEQTLPYQFVREPITRVAFVAYSLNEREPIEDFDKFEGLTVATIRGHAELFPFPVIELNDIHASLKMLVAKRGIDVMIVEQDAADIFIRDKKLSTVRRQLYRYFDASIIVQKSDQGSENAELLAKLLKRVKALPDGKRLIDAIHLPYRDWQPAEMNW